LREALERALENETLAALPPLDEVLDVDSYLGESDSMVAAALAGWRSSRPSSPAEAGTARP
jgi:hypothetical protein